MDHPESFLISKYRNYIYKENSHEIQACQLAILSKKNNGYYLPIGATYNFIKLTVNSKSHSYIYTQRDILY